MHYTTVVGVVGAVVYRPHCRRLQPEYTVLGETGILYIHPGTKVQDLG